MDKKTSALISLQRLAMEQVSLSLSLCRTVARARELAGSGRRLLGGAQLVTPGRGRVQQAGNQAEARAKVMLALSQGDSGRDSPEVGDGNVFSAAVADVRASGLLSRGASVGADVGGVGSGAGTGAGREHLPAEMQRVIYEILQEEMDERIQEMKKQQVVGGEGEGEARAAAQLAHLEAKYDAMAEHCQQLQGKLDMLEGAAGAAAAGGPAGDEGGVGALRAQLLLMESKHHEFKQASARLPLPPLPPPPTCAAPACARRVV